MGLLKTIIGGAFGIGAAKKQSNANLQAQREANETNLKIAQMNNDYNRAMFDEQMSYNREMWDKQSAFAEKQSDKANQFQLDMWNRNNEYNSASAQASRLREAGLNPYMMMNGGDAGSASFSGGNMAATPGSMGVNPPSASPVQVEPVLQDGSVYNAIQDMITNVMNSKRLSSDTKLVDEQARSVGIENKYKAMNLMTDIAQKIENTRNTKLKSAYQGIQNLFAKDMFQNEVDNGRMQYAIGQMQENIMATDYMMKQIQLAYLPDQINAELSQSLANIALTSAQKGYTEEQTRKVAQDRLESIARTEGIKLSSKERMQCLNAVVRLAKAKAEEAENNKYPRDAWQETYQYNFGGRGLRGVKAFRNSFDPLSGLLK